MENELTWYVNQILPGTTPNATHTMEAEYSVFMWVALSAESITLIAIAFTLLLWLLTRTRVASWVKRKE